MPSISCLLKKICKNKKDIEDLQNAPDLDQQQLSISGDTISLTNGGSVTITHPTLTTTTAQIYEEHHMARS